MVRAMPSEDAQCFTEQVVRSNVIVPDFWVKEVTRPFVWLDD